MQRLKTRAQFQAVLAGDKAATTPHFALHRCQLNNGSSEAHHPPRISGSGFSLTDVWLGAMVPKRWAKRAVTRNTIKRQIYNVSSDFESKLPLAAYVVRLRSGFDRTQFVSAQSDALKSAVRVELTQLFSRAAKAAAATPLANAAR